MRIRLLSCAGSLVMALGTGLLASARAAEGGFAVKLVNRGSGAVSCRIEGMGTRGEAWDSAFEAVSVTVAPGQTNDVGPFQRGGAVLSPKPAAVKVTAEIGGASHVRLAVAEAGKALGRIDATIDESLSVTAQHEDGSTATVYEPAGAAKAPTAEGLATYVNEADRLSPGLKENFVAFSFSYPKEWQLELQGEKPGAKNFVRVNHSTDDEFTIENFAVGTLVGGGGALGEILLPQLAKSLEAQFAPNLPGYRKVSEGKTKVGSYDGYEFRFSARFEETSRGPFDLWGRVVMLPPSDPKATHGITLVMLASSLARDVRGPEDVGEKGQLPIVLNSLKMH